MGLALDPASLILAPSPARSLLLHPLRHVRLSDRISTSYDRIVVCSVVSAVGHAVCASSQDLIGEVHLSLAFVRYLGNARSCEAACWLCRAAHATAPIHIHSYHCDSGRASSDITAMVVPPSVGGGTTMVALPSPQPAQIPPAVPGLSPGPSLKPKAPEKMTAPGTLNGPPSGNNHAIPLSARRAEPLDMSTVERRGQPNMRQERPKRERIFGIPEAPTYYPTDDEFRDPMEYMRKIAPDGRRYGIVKIVPPEGWNPTFAINTEVRNPAG